MIKGTTEGTVKKIFDLQQFSENFSKRSILIETEDKYNNEVCIDFINAQIQLLDSVKVGDAVKVYCDVFSRPSAKDPNRYFTNVKGWRIEHGEAAAETDDYIPPQTQNVELDDGLPF